MMVRVRPRCKIQYKGINFMAGDLIEIEEEIYEELVELLEVEENGICDE